METLQVFETLPYPPDAGAKIKAFYTLQHLAKLGPVDLICFARKEEQLKHKKALEEICRRVEIVFLPRSLPRECAYLSKSFLTHSPYTVIRHYHAQTAKRVRSYWSSGKYDLLYLNHLSSGQYMQPGAPALLDTHNAHYVLMQRFADTCLQGPKKWLALLEAHRLKRFERRSMEAVQNILAVSKEDADYLRAICPDSSVKVHVVPIGVDLDSRPFLGPSAGSGQLLFLGALHWPPNADAAIWMAQEILPLVRAKHPHTKLLIVGHAPPGRVRELDRMPGVQVLGYVEDLSPLLKETEVFVVPLTSGSGMRVKILDAFAWGLPVVSTTVGCEGIDAQPEEHLHVADLTQTFAEGVLRCIERREETWMMAQKARVLVEGRYAWPVVNRCLDEAIEEALRKHHGE